MLNKNIFIKLIYLIVFISVSNTQVFGISNDSMDLILDLNSKVALGDVPCSAIIKVRVPVKNKHNKRLVLVY